MKNATQPAYYFSANPLKAIKQPEAETLNAGADLKHSIPEKNNTAQPASDASLTSNDYILVPNKNIIEDIEKLHPEWYNNYE